MKNRGVIFSKNKVDETILEQFTITVDGDYSEYLATIKSLLSVLSLLPDSECHSYIRAHICNLISDMLPSEDQIKVLFDTQTSDKIKRE